MVYQQNIKKENESKIEEEEEEEQNDKKQKPIITVKYKNKHNI